MGCDIHSLVQMRDASGKWSNCEARIFLSEIDEPTSEPFSWRDYDVFAFLAGVRNYDNVPCITGEAGYGFPEDTEGVPERWEDYHSPSWLLLSELLAWDYDAVIPDFTGDGRLMGGSYKSHKYKDVFCSTFFKDLESLKTLGDPENVRILFCFDN